VWCDLFAMVLAIFAKTAGQLSAGSELHPRATNGAHVERTIGSFTLLPNSPWLPHEGQQSLLHWPFPDPLQCGWC
jgi:hypothetical protein